MISFTGVMLGVTVLILVISVMTGFERELRRKVIGFEAHVMVTDAGGRILEEWEETMRFCQTIRGVEAVAPFVQGPVLLEFDNRRLAPKIRGIDPRLESGFAEIHHYVVAGKFDLEGDKVLLGSELARALGAKVGDKVIVYSPGNLSDMIAEINRIEREGGVGSSLESLRELVLPAELEVTGIFESGRFLYDSEFLLVPLYIGQELYGLRHGVHGLALRLKNPYEAAEVAAKIRRDSNPLVAAYTWIDLNRQLFDAIKMERQVMFFLLLFIILVAAFGIMNTLITVTVQKTREIGILRALGAKSMQIIGVFLFQGMVVGAIGSAAGLGMGMALVRWRNEFSDWLAEFLGIEIFPASVYGFSQIPAEVVPTDVAIICASAFVICSLAALLPAWFAARLDPVQALRYE
ncbi:MAG: FtsX-like permease family protein [Chthoniobacterales bacterium]|nr:FtsX-like permease family protein [Chthoniobacterales bacterium]